MTRAKRVALWSAVTSVAYFLAFFAYIPVPFVTAEHAEQVLPVLPWWLLVSFGSYALWSLGRGLYTFRECTDAYTELLSEISQAKSELRVKGVSVD
ncbi:dolichol-phosphate mannosyltransferase subunit 3 [Gloeopeniophorella convolvens]|nr:dolichol-phosphate mannosyltransferase subunit 3 [Gloeopeniophorella convolvens]